MRINQNIAAFNAYNNLNNTQNRLSGSLEKLSSGFRINRAADDASGLVNSENLRSQIGGLKVATRNAQDAISLVQTAEGAQTEVHSILQRMRDLAVEAGNTGTNDSVSLDANQAEIEELQAELNRINSDTQFGTIEVFQDFQEISAVPTAIIAGATVAVADEFDDAGAGVTGDPSAATLDMSDGFVALDASGLVGYDGDIQLTVGATSVSDAVVFEVAYDATAQDVADAFNDAADASEIVATVDGDDVTFTTVGETATALGLEAETVDAVAAREASEGALFQIGANQGQTENVFIGGVSADILNVDDIDVTLDGDAGQAIADIDRAIADVSSNRADLGAFQNRMESLTRNLGVAVENLSAAESRIRDTDMAMEMVEFTRNQIMSQAGTAMLAQANVVPQSVLSLLG